MKVVLKSSKESIIKKITKDINSSNRYVGNGYKIAGNISNNKIYLNLEDRNSKSCKFFNEVFYGTIEKYDDKTAIRGNFKIDKLPLILLIILFLVAIESLIVSYIFYGFNSEMFLPAVILVVSVFYFLSFKKRSEATNKLIENYLISIDKEI